MALDGILLHKIIPGISRALPARIQKIYQISDTEVLFQLHGSIGKFQLLISCHSQYNRILITSRNYPTPDEPGNFVMVLRKYLEGATILSIEQAELDRWCMMTIRRHNNLGDLENMAVYIELMGRYANLILVNSSNRIIDAMKRIPPFENSRRIIQPGAEFHRTPSQDKRNPFTDPIIHDGMTLTQQFACFSPFLAEEAEYRLIHGQTFSDIMKEIESSDQLYISNRNNDAVFHCIELKSVGACRNYSLFEGFDILYFHKEEKQRVKEISGDVYHTAVRQLKHEKQKLPRLLKEMDEAMDCDRWNKYGELLYAWNVTDTKGQRSILLQDYETETDIEVPLDPKLDGRHNAQRCYAKYGKLKKGQSYLSEQIRICENEISYFEGLIEQLDQADFDTASEIREELIKGGYIDAGKNPRKRRRVKDTGPHITSVETRTGTVISFGKNNLQNEALTWHHARKTDIWLHAKDYHGAHVVIHDADPDESVLRLAANIAAYFSGGRSSSSVPVNWCPISNLKKISGAKPGLVQLGSYHTIYIDPDPDLLSEAGIEIG
ncbi:MAG: fibronectin/fibrinogen-binding protein [Erysipelotrichia bacterium]|nr:fibronectin/fibrinogen-binding protein [Erysipelotrichia bacterium]